MAASAHLLLDALSAKPEGPREADLFDGLSGPDCGLDGSGSFSFTEPPLTSEPPLADTAPLTSEVPISAEAPLTSEPTVTGLGTESMEI